MNGLTIQTSQRILWVLLVVLFVVFYSFLGIAGYQVFSDRDRFSEEADIDVLGERLVPLFYEINTFPQRVAQELLFFSKLSSLKNVAQNSSPEAYEELINDLLTFAQEDSIYHELRYIDENREEKVLIAYDGEKYYTVVGDFLSNVTEDSYVNDIFNLSEGEVYISKFDFAERAHSAGNHPETESILIVRFGTPVIGDDGKHEGIIAVEIHAKFFLDDISYSSRDNEQIYLLDQDGQYLVHPEEEKKYGTLLGTPQNFARDYPEVAGQVLSQFEKRHIESDTAFFSLRHIFPATSNFALARGSQHILGANPDRDFFWVLVSVTDRTALEGKKNIFDSFAFFMAFSGLLLIFILVALGFIFETAHKKDHNDVVEFR